MSVDIMTRLWWREDLSSSEKLVALAIADAAGDEGVAWPAVDTIARKASVSSRTVQNAIRSLEAKLLLRIVERKNRSSYYVFNLDNLPHVERERPMKERGPVELTGEAAAPVLDLRVKQMHPTGETGSVTGESPAPRNVIEPSEETTPPSPDGEVAPTDEDLFGGGLPAAAERSLEDRVVEAWGELVAEHPIIAGVRVLDDSRKKKISARADKAAKQLGLTPWQVWEQIFAAIRRSSFLCGRAPPGRDYATPFKLTLDKVLEPRRFNSILEGAHDDRPGNRSRTHTEDGRPMGSAEQAGRSILDSLRAARSQSGQPGHPGRGPGADHRRLSHHPG